MSFTFDTAGKSFTTSHGGEKFTFEAGKAPKWTGKSSPSAKKASMAYEEGLKAAIGKGGFKDAELNLIRTVASELGADAPDSLAKAMETFSHADQLKQALTNTALDKKAVAKLIIAKPESINLLAEAERAVLFDKKKININKIYALGDRVTTATKELEELQKAGTVTQEAVDKILVKQGPQVAEHIHPGLLSELNVGKVGSLVNGKVTDSVKGVDVVARANKISGKLSKLQGEVSLLADEAVSAKGVMDNARFGSRTKSTEAFNAKVTELKDLVNKTPEFKPYLEKTLNKHPEKEVLEGIADIKALMTDVTKAASSHAIGASKVAGEAAKSTEGFIAKHFKITPDFKAKQIESAAGNSEKIAKAEKLVLGDLRKMKVGLTIAGIGAVTYAAFAALGNKGPGKNADAVEASRGQQLSQGIA